MAPKLSLARTQSWMQDVIRYVGTDEQAVASKIAQLIIPIHQFHHVILPSRYLNSFERLGIYRGMYLARLREALKFDYPALHHFLGDQSFTELVAGYIRAYPSRSYTLNRLGDHLPEYIRSAPGISRRNFVYDLVGLELALSQLFEAEESPILTPEAIAAVPPVAWESARLKPIRAFRLLAFRYSVNTYLQSVRDGTPPTSARRKNTWVVVYRREYSLWRLDLTRAAYDLLQALASGMPLGEAVASLLRGKRPIVREEQLFSWFRGWVAEGLFQAIELPGA